MFKLYPDYWKSTLGSWDLGQSIFDAILTELRTINAFARQMRRPPLFRNECHERPREFTFLMRPTNREYRVVVLTLDQLLADNLSADFFMDEVETSRQKTRKDGTVEVERKGTIALLEEWLGEYFTAREPDLIVSAYRASEEWGILHDRALP